MGQGTAGPTVQPDAEPVRSQGDVQVSRRPYVGKRLLDLLLSGLALLVVGPLILLPVMLILRFTGEHHVWYFQERLGLGGERFR
ncbi:MAG: sugar transferase, partial [Phycisphaeraceae bacterium]